MATHSIADHLLFALLLIVPFIEWRWTWPRFLARLAMGDKGVRGRFYRGIVITQWTVVLLFIAYWRLDGRPWTWLLLGWSTPLRFGCGMAFAAIAAGFLYWQRVQILAGGEKTQAAARKQLESAEPLLPHGPNGNRMFKIVSVTAGVCEEVLFRGFLLWYFAAWTGTAVAVILSSLVFGLGHFYLGAKHIPKTAGAGVVLACLSLASRSLWPAMVIHAAMDWNSGAIGYALFRPRAEKPAPAVQS